MDISLNITLNPGEDALFVTEARIERSRNIYDQNKVWWALWISWWLYSWRKRREWFWTWEKVDEGVWYTWSIMLLGFEINWQWRRKG